MQYRCPGGPANMPVRPQSGQVSRGSTMLGPTATAIASASAGGGPGSGPGKVMTAA